MTFQPSNPTLLRSQFELLLPVGQKEMALAAIHNGADAIFVGFPGFNARGRSYDFQLNELNEIIETCHAYGVKVNLAFNIVIFENELQAAFEALQKVIPLKPDALIIQDLGLVRLVKHFFPEQAVHASTQMTVTNDLAISLVDDLNIKRFVLGRENSLAEIKAIAEKTKKELEVFVHGALCVSYSGQCFTSETLGGRSANRGQCAQSCRFEYEMIVDGQKKNLVDQKYLVSPQDLCGLAEIPELMKIGVQSFKVEGRLKTPEYVASVAQSFRQVMDKVLSQNEVSVQDTQKLKNNMAIQYSRGFFSGWLHGVNHQKLVEGTFSSHRGLCIGKITKILLQNEVEIELFADQVKNIELTNGDGLLFVSENKQTKGGFIYEIKKLKDSKYKLCFSKDVRFDHLDLSSLIYLNHQKDLKKQIQKSFTDKNLLKKIKISFQVLFQENLPLEIKVTDGIYCLTDKSTINVTRAQNKPVLKELFYEELSALGGTIFNIENPEQDITFLNSFSENLFISHKELKQLRQRLTQKLFEIRSQNKVSTSLNVKNAPLTQTPNQHLNNDVFNLSIHSDLKVNSPSENSLKSLKLNILLRQKEQVSSFVEGVLTGQILQHSIACVILDFEFGRDYLPSIELIRAKTQIKVGLATTRILKPLETQNLKNIVSLKPDLILVRNLGALYYLKNVAQFAGELKGDFSLNVTNHLTADYLVAKGLNSFCLSYDLNDLQVKELLKATSKLNSEITVHQSMPSFHMEHCVFAAFLSKGSSYKDCGKPCEKHKVQLKDQFGHFHWIKPDQECRNTMFNAQSQTALKYLESWSLTGLKEIRFEALHEAHQELLQKISTYQKFINHEISLEQALLLLQSHESYGLSEGQLSKDTEYKARKKDHQFLRE